jgi:hypothetical protein
MSPPKSKVPPHVFVPDPDVPADHTGRQACRCGLVGEPNDAHHTMPEVPEQAESRRRAGDDE